MVIQKERMCYGVRTHFAAVTPLQGWSEAPIATDPYKLSRHRFEPRETPRKPSSREPNPRLPLDSRDTIRLNYVTRGYRGRVGHCDHTSLSRQPPASQRGTGGRGRTWSRSWRSRTRTAPQTGASSAASRSAIHRVTAKKCVFRCACPRSTPIAGYKVSTSKPAEKAPKGFDARERRQMSSSGLVDTRNRQERETRDMHLPGSAQRPWRAATAQAPRAWQPWEGSSTTPANAAQRGKETGIRMNVSIKERWTKEVMRRTQMHLCERNSV